MKTVVITESFEGYPNGKKVAFAAGEELTLSDAYADLIVGKGHARHKPADAPSAKSAARAALPAKEQDDEAV